MKQLAQLSLPAFEVLWEDLRAGSIPYPVDVSQHGETLDDRARIGHLSDPVERNLQITQC